MTNHQEIAEKLSQFNNLSFTKKQWEIILKGCGCPKSTYLWTALRKKNLQAKVSMYTLVNMDKKAFEEVWNIYTSLNRAAVKKHYEIKRLKEKVAQRRATFTGVTLFLVNGCLSPFKPERED